MRKRDEKKYFIGKCGSKVVENRLLYKKFTPFALMLMQRKGMIISAKNVCLGGEKLDIDHDVFESSDDVMKVLKDHNKLLNDDVAQTVKAPLPATIKDTQKHPISGKEPHCLLTHDDGRDFRNDRERLIQKSFVSSVMVEAGHISSNKKKIGLAGCRKQFSNDVSDNNLDVITNHMIDIMMNDAE